MNKNSKLTNALLSVLIILSLVNLFIGISNSAKIRQLEQSPAVVITQTTTPSIVTMPPTAEDEEITESSPVSDETEEVTDEEVAEKAVKEETENDNSGFCYVTNSGTKYHKENCSYLKKSATKLTVSQAKSSGYTPCSRCY